ncbi:MAG: tetratricopeptide repeat-containing diguanylate cyclase [Paraglaciecola sp.]|uniref:tetratricopeptide repeat-containing diguanylate cyclase n=1 Tax=Paraglaciecola sp. TaxID=1920173 RepID=UPI0032646C61
MIIFVLLNNFSQAQQQPELSAGYQSAKKLINAVRGNQLDYLKHALQLEETFETIKKNSWEALHLEAAALYSELLFRQEKYLALAEHLETYIEVEALKQQWDLYLLFQESKLKLLLRQEDTAAQQSLAKQLEEWLPERHPKQKIIILRTLAYYHTNKDGLKNTLNVALTGLKLSKADDDLASQGFFLRKIGDTYNFLEEKDKGLEFSQRAVNVYEQTKDELFTAKAHWSLGNTLLEAKETKQAIVYLKKALAYFKSVNMLKGLTFSQYSLASVLFSEQQYKDALSLANQNAVLAKSAGVYDMQLASMILISDIYLEQGLFENANEVNDQVFSILDKFTRSSYKSNFLAKRYELKRRLNLTDDAFEAIEQELFFTKKHLEATSENNIKTLQVKFEVKEKEDEILRLAHQKDISEFKAKEEYQQKLIWRLSTAIAIILIAVSLLLFFRQVRQRQKYHSIALTDYLTNCPNRRGIMQAAADKVQKQGLTIAIVDLDFFKKINDQFGHDVGDLVLVAFADAAQKTLRKHDKFGRYGGEEWLFVLNTTNISAVQDIFTRLSKNFASYCIDIKANNPAIDWAITFSMGATISTKTSTNLEELITEADKRLYEAKENGRNQLIIQ